MQRIVRRILPVFAALMLLVAAAAAAHVGADTARAAETTYQNPLTAAPPLNRPTTRSCVVTLSDNVGFANAQNSVGGTLTPPAACPGPWSMVALDWTGSVKGRQYDRIGAVWVGGVELLRSSTPEPTAAGITWHVEKDVSEYGALFAQPQPFRVSMENYVFGPYTGTIYLTVTLTFYETSAQYPAAAHPDQVLPISQSAAFPWYLLSNPTQQASATLTLPRDLTRAYLEVYTSGHSCDEFWYGNQPDDYASANGLCGGTAFREAQVLVDGKMAGVAWPFPFIYTGGINPYLWRPIPGVGAFNLPPYVVDLTPFAGLLSDGNAHTIGIRVANNSSFWLTDGDLLLYQSAGDGTTSGAVTTNTIAPSAAETVQENANTKSATFDTAASRTYTVSGYVHTAAGIVTTTIERTMSFSNSQVLNLVNFVENVKHTEQITTKTTTSGPDGTTVTTQTDSYPLSMTSAFQIPRQQTGDAFILPATVDQTLDRTVTTMTNGVTTSSSALTDAIHGEALLMRDLTTGQNIAADGHTTESYIYSDSAGACFNHTLSAAQGTVTVDQLKHTC